MAEWVTDIDGDGVLEYHKKPESSGSLGGGSAPGYIKPGTEYVVTPSDNLQELFDSFEGKWCPGTVAISLQPGTYNSNGTFAHIKPNGIKKLVIQGSGIDVTKIKKTNVQSDYEQTLLFVDQDNVEVMNLTVEGENTRKTVGIQANGSKVILRNVNIINCGQAWISGYEKSYILLAENITCSNAGTTKVDFGVLASNCSSIVMSQTPISFNNATQCIRSEMCANVAIFYTPITWTNVSTKYTPGLNNHTGNGFILGTEG